jgi:hypothetical protein
MSTENASTTGYRALTICAGRGVHLVRCGQDGLIAVRWDDETGRPRMAVHYAGEGIDPLTWYESTGGALVARPDVLAIDNRGYVLTYVDGLYTAGCRERKTAEWALAHWADPDHEAPDSAAILLAAVRANEATR